MSKEERELLKKIVLFLMRTSVEKTLREVLQSKQGNQEEKKKEDDVRLRTWNESLEAVHTHTHTHTSNLETKRVVKNTTLKVMEKRRTRNSLSF